IGADVDVIVAGHTHLERSIKRSRGQGHYFNSGTWARMIEIKGEVRKDAAAFGQLFKLLDGASMQALDDARITVGSDQYDVIARRNTVVVIEKPLGGAPAGGNVRASLQHVAAATDALPIRLEAAGAALWSRG